MLTSETLQFALHLLKNLSIKNKISPSWEVWKRKTPAVTDVTFEPLHSSWACVTTDKGGGPDDASIRDLILTQKSVIQVIWRILKEVLQNMRTCDSYMCALFLCTLSLCVVSALSCVATQTPPPPPPPTIIKMYQIFEPHINEPKCFPCLEIIISESESLFTCFSSFLIKMSDPPPPHLCSPTR